MQNNNLTHLFLNSLSQRDILFFSIRGNCGEAALSFISFATKNSDLEFSRVWGFVKLDQVLYDKEDFTKDMINEFCKDYSYLIFLKSPETRKYWIENSKYSNQWKYCPHYWVCDQYNNIYDPAGILQFLNKNLVQNLNDRYSLSDIEFSPPTPPISINTPNNQTLNKLKI